jgi:cytochrome subunit of sulfide dehydrogenase
MRTPSWRAGALALLMAFGTLSIASAQAPAPAPAPAANADPNLARNLAATCANCHGTNGRSVGGMTVLAGYPRDTMITAMKEFRDGKRPATIMHQLTKGYTDAQIELIATYLSQQKK